ncbi:unnamed protein product [Lymnaea stagnalis]|uniref:MD-2-related lipid-recognition domain-containing protein n=1 Tax=Lymnaea stagnalis TaxID=6523 RepID=A0AAV2I922_LYMST
MAAMKILLPSLLLLSLTHAPCLGKQQHTVHMFVHKVADDDSGHAVKCGKVDFNFTWTPKDLSPSGEVTVLFEYTTPNDMDGGLFNATLYNHAQPGEIIMQYGDSFDCDFLKKYGVPCPIKKNQSFHITKKIPNLQLLSNYPGTYDAILQIWNSQNEEMICANLTVTVLDV